MRKEGGAATDSFFTLKGFALHATGELTYAEEDYLEMICRMAERAPEIRLTALSGMLHVRPSSATKMVQSLCRGGYLDARRYGNIALTEKGREAGRYLLYRHGVLNRFLCYLNGTADEVAETEKLEHFLRPETVRNLDALTARLARPAPEQPEK